MIGLAFYDNLLTNNEAFATYLDVFVASIETVYSAGYISYQTYLVTVNFNANSIIYKKALAFLEIDFMMLTRI
jgi:hypothetical protein